MKLFVVALCLIAGAVAAPTGPDADAMVAARRSLPAVDHQEIHDQYGQFALRYVTAEGTIVSERGRLVPNPDGSDYVMVFEGEVSYIGDDGQVYVTKYTAGLDGTHVEGNHLPVPVTPVPVEPIETPVEVVEEPVEEIVEPVEVIVKEPVMTEVIGEPFEVVGEPIEVVREPIRIIAEPMRIVYESA